MNTRVRALALDFLRDDVPAAAAAPVPPPFRQAVGHCRSADGVRVAFATCGHGPVLVKTANGLSHLDFDSGSPVWGHAIAELSSDHTLVRHDRRGCGLSDWDVPPVTFDQWVADLDAVVTAQGLERFALLGVSDGAAVALAYAARFPERVSRLVLHGAWARPGARTGPACHDPAMDDLREAATSVAMDQRMREVENTVDLTSRLDRVRCPTLLLHAAGDPEVPVTEAEWLVSQLSDARLVTLDSHHHLPRPDEAAWPAWLRALRGFLPREPDAGSPLAGLTARELDVLDLLAQGRDNTTISEALGLNMKTVRNHVSNLYRKLGTGNRLRSATVAAEAGWGRTFRPGPGR